MSALAARRAAKRAGAAAHSPALREKLRQMAQDLHPLVAIDTGAAHPSFPRTLLHYWLLTEGQLDDLAHFYHQRTPGVWTRCYPCPVRWPREGLTLEQKRRKLGRFIGLQGCESPLPPPPPPPPPRFLPSSSSSSDSRVPRCTGDCLEQKDPATAFCMECSMRRVGAIFGTESSEFRSTAEAEARQETEDAMDCDEEEDDVDVIMNNSEGNDSNNNNGALSSSPRLSRWRSRPATRSSASRSSSRSSSAARSSSPYASCYARPSRLTSRPRRPLTVEEVVERARLARLAEDADKEVMRGKQGPSYR